MSTSADAEEGSRVLRGLESLEEALEGLLDRLDEVEERARSARERAERAEAALREVTGEDSDPGVLLERVERLESENTDLHRRLTAGREAVDRLLSKVRFLEERERADG